jgi:hypothetical protein
MRAEHRHHDHDHHDHSHGGDDHHHAAHRPHAEPVVLEIGAELGALIVYTDPDLLHTEVEISPAADDTSRSHKDVLERVVDGCSLYTAVFDRMPGGEYTLWHEGAALSRGVRVPAGAIAELDWTSARRAA